MNSRFLDCLECATAIYECAKNFEVDDIWNLGDLFEKKNNIDSLILTLTLEAIKQMASEYPMLLVPGTHDYRLWASDPRLLKFLTAYSGAITIGDGWIGDIFVAPYSRKVSELNAQIETLETDPNKSIFLGHQDIQGVYYGKYQMPTGLDADMLSKKFKWAFLGHYHNAKEIRENVISIGAPLQHSFSDLNAKCGWWIYDDEKNELKFVENRFSPRFWDVQYFSNKEIFLDGDLQKDFYRVLIKGTELPEQLHEIKWKRVSYDTTTQSKKRTSVIMSDSIDDILKKYVEYRWKGKDKDELIKVGKRYI